jgi:hypothetical protein
VTTCKTSLPIRARSVSRGSQRRLMAWWMDQVMTAVENDIVIAETLFRVRNLTAPPTRLQEPSFHARVVAANLKRRHTYFRSPGSPGSPGSAGQHQVKEKPTLGIEIRELGQASWRCMSSRWWRTSCSVLAATQRSVRSVRSGQL